MTLPSRSMPFFIPFFLPEPTITVRYDSSIIGGECMEQGPTHQGVYDPVIEIGVGVRYRSSFNWPQQLVTESVPNLAQQSKREDPFPVRDSYERMSIAQRFQPFPGMLGPILDGKRENF